MIDQMFRGFMDEILKVAEPSISHTINGINHEYSVIEDSKDVASVVFSENIAGGGTIYNLYVDPDHRGKGLSKSLLSRVISDHGEKDIHIKADPYLDMPIDMKGLQSIYSKFGFKPVSSDGWMVRPPK